MPSGVERKLTTILAADAEGYSRVMESDEIEAIGALRAARKVFSKFIERHHGRIANTAGDGLIAEFPSVVEAVQCAIEVQGELNGGGDAPGGALPFRIGVHLGDVIVDGADLLGEGVNLAARLQTMAEPGGIVISQQVYDQVHGKLSVGFDYLGEKRPRNFAEDVAVYRISLGAGQRGGTQGAHRIRPARVEETAPPDRGEPRQRVIRQAKLLGAIWAMLVAVDVATGAPFWAHWPGIAMAAIVALKTVPLFLRSWPNIMFGYTLVIAGALILINLVTWSGYPWAIWPAGGLMTFALIYRLGLRAH